MGLRYYNGVGVTQSYDQARSYFEKAAAAGNVEAKNHLGQLYLFGQGVAQDVILARSCFEEAAVQEHGPALRNLGNIYLQGNVIDGEKGIKGWIHGVGRDLPRALALYNRAAAQGDSDAMVTLGIFSLNGVGVEKDLN